MDVQTILDARWQCKGCGDCCRGFSFGPVEPDIIAAIERADIAAKWSPAAQQPWRFTQPGPDGAPAAYLTSVDGHCIFLQDDQRCALHRLLGGDQKPWFCREYPFYPVEDADGRVSVAVRGDCGGLHESFEDGPLISDQVADVLSLPRVVPRAQFNPEHVVLLPGLAISVAAWRQVEGHLLQRLTDPQSPTAAVAAARSMLYTMAQRDAPAASSTVFHQAVGAVMETLHRAAPHPLLETALQRWDGAIPTLDASAQRYVLLLMRGALLTRQFGSVGIPAMVGLLLVETAIAAMNATAPSPLSAADLGQGMPVLKRWIRGGECWSQVPALRPALEAVFAHAT